MLKRKVEISRTSPQNILLAVVMCDDYFANNGYPEFDLCIVKSFSGGAKLLMTITTKKTTIIEYEILMTGFKSTKDMTLRAITEINKMCQSLNIPYCNFNYLYNRNFPKNESVGVSICVEDYSELIESFKQVDKLSNNKKYYLLYFGGFGRVLQIKLGKKSAIYHVLKLYYKLFKNRSNKNE